MVRAFGVEHFGQGLRRGGRAARSARTVAAVSTFAA